MFKKYVAIAGVCVLAGCTNIGGLRADLSSIPASKVTIVPTGIFNVEGETSGGPIGLIPALIYQATNSSDREASTARAKQINLGNEVALATAKSIMPLLESTGKFTSVEIHEGTLGSDKFSSWFSINKRTDLLSENSTQGGLLLDYGFQGLSIYKNAILGSYASGTLGVRLIDNRTGNVIGRAKASGISTTSGVRIAADENQPEYEAAVKAAFEQLVGKLAGEALQSLF